MRKFVILLLCLALTVPLFSQTGDPGRLPRWDRLMDYVKNGQYTMTYKTLTSPTFTSPTISGTLTLSAVTNLAEKLSIGQDADSCIIDLHKLLYFIKFEDEDALVWAVDSTGKEVYKGGAVIDNVTSADVLNLTETTVRVTGILDVTGATTLGSTLTVTGAAAANATNATTNTWVRAIYGTATASGSAMTTGYGAAGVRGLVNVTGTSTGQAYFYGTQGKFTPSAAAVLDGGSWYTGLMGQMDLTAASTYTSTGCISALWLDAGASAGANAKAAAPTLVDMAYITNTAVGFLPHSLIKTVAYATNFMSLANGDGTATGWLAAGGTDCTASGATAPSYTIKIDVAGTPAYIRVWAAP